MRIRSAPLVLAAALAAAVLAAPAAAQRRSAPVLAQVSTAPAFPSLSTPEGRSVRGMDTIPLTERFEGCRLVVIPVSCDGRDRYERYVNWGIAIGGAAGLAWGLYDRFAWDNPLGLSPVVETAIGAGTGFYVGTAVFLVRYAGRRDPEPTSP